MYPVKTELIVSAYENDIDLDKLEEYTNYMSEMMLSNEFPPIHWYWSIADWSSQEYFMNWKELKDCKPDEEIFILTDWHHRVLAAIATNTPYLWGIDCPLYS